MKDRVGQRHGRLTVKSFHGRFRKPNNKYIETYWICDCDCGKINVVISGRAFRGTDGGRSCGCVKTLVMIKRNTTHSDSKSNEYGIWLKIKSRCLTKKDKAYKDYGGRGIKICKRWMDYNLFIDDMGRRPTSKHSIERINNNKGYSKSNCRWATQKEQMNNTRSNVLLFHNGYIKTISQWAEVTGLKYSTLHSRVRRKSHDIFGPLLKNYK